MVNNNIPDDVIQLIQESYSIKTKGFFSKKPKLSAVVEPTESDTLKLPNWISNKRYITENADAIKYEPEFLMGSLTRLYQEDTFEVYPVTYNVRIDNEPPELSKIDKPVNFFEQTFNSLTRFNSNFLIGGITISKNEILKVTYTETNYVILKKYDDVKLKNLRNEINKIGGANLKDWAIVTGIVILDCTYSKNIKTQADANIKASWLSADGEFYKQTDDTNNFRLVSIDLENLFL